MSEDQDQDSKTEQPTGRKLSKAREEGNVVLSQEFRSWIILAGGFVIVALMAPGLMAGVRDTVRPFIEMPHAFPTDSEGLRQALADVLQGVAFHLMLPLGLLLLLALAGTIMQTGLMFTASKLKPDLSKIDPLKNFKQKFMSAQPVVELLKSLLKLALVSGVVAVVMWAHRGDVQVLPALEMEQVLRYLHDKLLLVIGFAMGVITVIAALDYAWQRFSFTKKMRMTKQEVRDEFKQTEGDPMIKARIRSLRQERARQRMMQAVPKADVVVTNPTHYAVALKYDIASMNAPVLVAKGADLVAKRIRDIAQENDVPIVENPPLARALFASVELDQEIPPQHYKPVAEIIGYVMRLKGKLAH